MLPVERCPLCGGEGRPFVPSENVLALEGFDKFFEVYSADVCQTCGTIYQNPCMSANALIEYYSTGAYRIDHPPNLVVEEGRAERLALLVERFKINPKSILDVGCGRGTLLKYLEINHFARVLGLDYSYEPPEIDNIVHSKDDVDDKFDLITCIHVMEHMLNPVKELEWMLSKLNPGGTILLEIPTYLCNDMSHIFVPNRRGLEIMLDNLGLEYLYVAGESACNILIGPNYSKYDVKEVFYTAESPDFDTKKEAYQWLSEAYG
jgi:SAM-dependent methyltransferase